jgi:hypothetical protein
MPEVSTTANHLTAHALFQTGASIRSVAQTLGISPYSAWALKHRDLPDPSLVHHISKTISDKLLLAASSATDVILDKAMNDELKDEKPIELAKMASICLQSAGAYAALSGAKDTLGAIAAEFGIAPSHSASRVTLEQKITVESSQPRTPQPVVFHDLENTHVIDK